MSHLTKKITLTNEKDTFWRIFSTEKKYEKKKIFICIFKIFLFNIAGTIFTNHFKRPLLEGFGTDSFQMSSGTPQYCEL